MSYRDGRESPLVSVVIPTYYRNERLREAIESVESQTHSPVETIVVDGSGEAHARPVIEEFDVETYVPQESDEGPQAARSIGADRATGRYVQFLDDDDRLRDTKLERQISLFDNHPQTGVVFCGWLTESGDARLPDPSFRGDVLADTLRLRGSTCLTSTMLVRAEVLESILPLRNRHGADDVGMKIELARRTEFDYVDEPLIVRGEPVANLGYSWSAVEGRRDIIDRYAGLYDQHPPEVRQAARANLHRHAGWTLLSQGVWSPRAIVAFGRAVLAAPDLRLKLLGEFVSSFAGRPGLRVSTRAWYTMTDRL
jgi:glycosyltransferase involved in cell wall biosynthesis